MLWCVVVCCVVVTFMVCVVKKLFLCKDWTTNLDFARVFVLEPMGSTLMVLTDCCIGVKRDCFTVSFEFQEWATDTCFCIASKVLRFHWARLNKPHVLASPRRITILWALSQLRETVFEGQTNFKVLDSKDKCDTERERCLTGTQVARVGTSMRV